MLVSKKNEEVTHRNRPDQEHYKQNRQSVNWERKKQGFDTKPGKAVSEVKWKVRSSEKPGIAKKLQ